LRSPISITDEEALKVREALRELPGIVEARISQRGVWLKFRPDSVTSDEIIQTLRQSGLRAGVFQDSETGKEGHSSQ
jgi:hypothetical protein